TIAGDQMARAGTLPARVGPWLATALTLVIGSTLLVLRRREVIWFKPKTTAITFKAPEPSARPSLKRFGARQLLVSFPCLLDLGLLRLMPRSFLFGFFAFALLIAAAS